MSGEDAVRRHLQVGVRKGTEAVPWMELHFPLFPHNRWEFPHKASSRLLSLSGEASEKVQNFLPLTLFALSCSLITLSRIGDSDYVTARKLRTKAGKQFICSKIPVLSFEPRILSPLRLPLLLLIQRRLFSFPRHHIN
jgi:hypothetical protein